MEGDVAHRPDFTGPPGPRPAAGAAGHPTEGGADTASTAASHAVTALYRSHALGLTRLAFLMLSDRHAAEDVVQEAFCGLWMT